ncbi:2-dehydro-3-deoxy-6-phosphogalactonate aldolase [Elstera cyanobacteriorum]|uniref:2-dehydro-3-deoxy-6-phosphogalactonate aldolase n=1 Tax=Elstera cyanobacteriorum TaxID=2022747 RepID=UPI0023526C01|nr:2-dehydro-3-deoxy-6-phosphogalactonate aldolase [Elstera cyanobacteriorum]MCK6441543.1 2-dehydro-3-deoxy-6-phosphogalactonate aldolase [Elstera cyanobacteriorum]
MSLWSQIADLPLVAILRGLRPEDAETTGAALIDAGFRAIEVPLNSPDPFTSIARLVQRFGNRAVIGAGTVLTVGDVERLAETGAKLMVSPNTDPAVIVAAKAAGLYALPGFFTATEAFAALHAGADGLKLFPAETTTPAHVKALKAVLPPEIPVFAVGGVTPETMTPWIDAGAQGFGLGSALFKPGMAPGAVGDKARAFAAAWAALART